MKKLWMGFAACALILSSCNKQEVFENIDQNNNQLQFNMAMGAQTRAAELTNAGLKGTGGAISNDEKAIKLYAYQELASNTWSYWYTSNLWWGTPSGGSVDMWNINSVRFANVVPTKYYSYYPQQDKGGVSINYNPATGNVTPGTTPKIAYTASTTVASQVDLVGGITDVSANATQVQIKMRHLLSQINFGVYGYKGANIEIGTITIKGVSRGGVYTFKSSDGYPLGTWAPSGSGNYSYAKAGTTAPATATTGHKYLFGDGGKWAVGPNSASVWYWDAAKNGGAGWNNPANIADANKLSNSLMLIPQDLTGATVEFQYRISDVDNGYTAGSSGGWALGTFSLNFNTGGTTTGTDYFGKWEENFRYVYMIDFTDFLDGRVQTFSVDVEAYPWENYNNGGVNDGIVDIAVLGQTTLAAINTLTNGNSYYMASQSTATPTTAQKAQLITDAVWDWSSFDFAKLEKNQTVTISFQNVLFNGKTISLKLPTGYSISGGTKITAGATNPYTISGGDGSTDANIVITNDNDEYITDNTLNTAVKALNTSTTLIYKGTAALNLSGIEPLIANRAITVTLKVWNGIVPTVGNTDNGVWTWNAATKTATWVTR